MSRIKKTFAELQEKGRRGFVPFIMAGDPTLEKSRDLLIEIANSGASVIEFGVPFSDPVADGATIQRAAERALKNDFGIAEILEIVRQAREKTNVPIVLFSYFNPLLQFGIERLSREASAAGIDGVLVTDLVDEEAAKFAETLRTNNLDLISLVAPTSSDVRLKRICKNSSGFVYAVSRAGVTGERSELSNEAEKLVKRTRQFTDLPVAVGFGISTQEHVEEVWRYADAAVVGSAIVAEIEREGNNPDLVEKVGKFVRNLLPNEHK